MRRAVSVKCWTSSREEGASRGRLAFAVRQPLLQDLVAAEFVAPHRCRHVAPVGVVVEVDVERGCAEGSGGPSPNPLPEGKGLPAAVLIACPGRLLLVATRTPLPWRGRGRG